MTVPFLGGGGVEGRLAAPLPHGAPNGTVILSEAKDPLALPETMKYPPAYYLLNTR